MEINPNSSLPEFNKSSQKKRISQSRPTVSTGNTGPGIRKAASLSALQEELKAMPEVRPERLAEGRVLKGNPDYPSKQELRDLGKLVINSELENTEADE